MLRMGRTIPSYRIGSEIEILKWRPFGKLLDKQDRKKFDEMLSIPTQFKVYNEGSILSVLNCSPKSIQV